MRAGAGGHTCVLSSQESPCAVFSKPRQQPVSVSDLSELCVCAFNLVYVQTCTSVYLCTHQSVSVCHALHLPSPVALFAALSAPTPRCHLPLFPIINSALAALAVTTNYSLSCPMTSDPSFPLACYMPNTVLRPSDPDCLVFLLL